MRPWRLLDACRFKVPCIKLAGFRNISFLRHGLLSCCLRRRPYWRQLLLVHWRPDLALEARLHVQCHSVESVRTAHMVAARPLRRIGHALLNLLRLGSNVWRWAAEAWISMARLAGLPEAALTVFKAGFVFGS